MSISIVGNRYANAIFELAGKDNAVAEVGKHLTEFAASYAENKELRAVFENPSFSQEVRHKILRDIAGRSGMHDTVKNALLLLSDRGRLGHLSEVLEAYDAKAQAQSGEVRAEVTTAADMPEAYFVQLQKRLAEVTGKNVVLVKKTDPSLIGGVVTRIGDTVFDGSLKNRLNGLKEELLR